MGYKVPLMPLLSCCFREAQDPFWNLLEPPSILLKVLPLKKSYGNNNADLIGNS